MYPTTCPRRFLGSRGSGHDHVETAPVSLLGQAGCRRHAQKQEANGDLPGVDPRCHDVDAATEQIMAPDVIIKAQNVEAREYGDDGVSGPEPAGPARRPFAVPFAPEHGVGVGEGPGM